MDHQSPELPIFNTDQFTTEAIEKEPVKKMLLECVHLDEIRPNPALDFFGYQQKVQVKMNGEIVRYYFMKSCAACIAKGMPENSKLSFEIVAREKYALLSDRTFKAFLRDPSMVLLSERAKKLAAEVESEEPDLINLVKSRL